MHLDALLKQWGLALGHNYPGPGAPEDIYGPLPWRTQPAAEQQLAQQLPPTQYAPRNKAHTRISKDYETMQALADALNGQGITEGPNANIRDDSRQRALAWAARQ